MTDTVQVTRDGAVATVWLNRPERMNALNLDTWRRLGEILQALNAEEDLRCLLLRGRGGKAFGAGADISEFEVKRFSAAQAEAYAETMHPALDALTDSPHPTLAAIEGACTGGGLELALCCDLRLCNASARFGIPINRIGHVLPYEGLVPLVRLVGRAVALELLLEGRVIGAQEAYEKRLVNRVVADADFEEELAASAARIAAGAPLAARWHKQNATRALDPRPLSPVELAQPFQSCDSDDYREGVRAFLAKRRPVFEGR
ncbi:Enoyl-CoA hydratase/carnithine racemase [Tistlia consotensis]|uniref:Enoyl-CoA hydratase/carnithine racemase n=1 Tax=Tistlia consotensis USBA 355 TaxID=560819 RepID=A0A1Y6B410_9PROT|nr:enoyl-CoA hydratase-related protein [Tistlia consotensis]SME88228.1 Enoyl-CoA hydratase/carnithine racemase [Tistlia consotensis USBA 355]SNR24684.1 Enoyl-CoA hydratase/carnithine racemase [Tistlia consotensis]